MISLPTAFRNVPLTHRTLHDVSMGRPENSVEGAIAAIEVGYGIEIDLQLSRDGVAMVFHDYELDRLTGETGYVKDRCADELSEMILSHGQTSIPRFDDFLKLVDGRVPLLVELKSQNIAFGAEDSGMVMAVKSVLGDYAGPIAFMSFNPHMVAQFYAHLPEYPRGLVTGPYGLKNWPDLDDRLRQKLAAIPDYDRVGASFISHSSSNLGSLAVANIRAKGGAILCWTIKSAAQEQEARKYADNITFERYLAAL